MTSDFQNLVSKFSPVFIADLINVVKVSSDHSMRLSCLHFTLVVERSAPRAAGRTSRSYSDKSNPTYGYKVFSC